MKSPDQDKQSDEKKKSKEVNIEKLIKDNPNDPRIGQGYNDARGDFPDTELDADFKNLRNHTGPEQKKKKEPHIGVVRAPESHPETHPDPKK